MEKKNLKKLSKSQLIKLLLKQEAKKPSDSINEHAEIIKPIPRKSVKEDLILPPPEQLQDGYKPLQKQNARKQPKPSREPPPPPIPQVEEKEHITSVPVPKIKN